MEIQEHEALAKRAAYSAERGKAIKSLNLMLQRYDYDEVKAWENESIQEILGELKVIDKKEWDMEVFVNHVHRLKRLKQMVRG